MAGVRRQRPQCRLLLVMVALLVLAAGCTSTSPSTDGSSTVAPTSGAGPATERFTPIVMTVMSEPRWFTGTDGKIHVVCELELTNGFPSR